MTENQKLKVFLCHAKDDKSKVRELYQRLVAEGFDVWFDEEKLMPGYNWDLEIRKAVRESDIVIVCVSNRSITKDGYVQKEIRLALDFADEKPEGEVFIIPARLEDCPMPDRLMKWQWVDLFAYDGYERLRLSLHQHVSLLVLSEKNQSLFTHLALWGVTGSGKTWLINSFAKELSWHNENDQDFEYTIRDLDGMTLPIVPLSDYDSPATATSEDYVWLFSRRERQKNSSGNSFGHQLIVHDAPGRQMIDMVNELSWYERTIYQSIFRFSNNIIILLDPTNMKGSPFASSSSELTEGDYERLLSKLIEIGLAGKSHLRIAVCLSKSDLINSFLPPEELIEGVFGENIIKIFESKQVSSRFFRVSSVGFIKRNGKRRSNLSDGQELLDPDHWNPINVVSPFFWLFEELEKEQINRVGKVIRDYKPYPQPRLIFPE